MTTGTRGLPALGDALGPEPLRGRALFRAWFPVVTAAEMLGFAVPALVGALTAASRAWVSVPALLLAGAVEGAVLGAGQAAVLSRAVPGLSRRRWVLATAGGAVVAYAIGLTPSTAADAISGWPPLLLATLGAGLGLALLATIGVAQWWVLRRHVPHAYRWIVATGLAWLAGLAVFLGFAMPLWQPGQPLALVLAIGVAGGLLMAAAMAAVTGAALRRLLAGAGR
ncbi:hypothetical protein GCM10020358_08400 [Amorphoplanes nipponensis]|uniref:Uncharacterized protein n=1 Tax=Actinoplanes nipponensis TaxID=135950 RepID=A0A919MN15_9ACTN|nr:hypothetical protein [Actinoplanes nipponensis]GIE48003.1 hypothetical protein Ani05nite_15370 [Actinoplanes nipponensis]